MKKKLNLLIKFFTLPDLSLHADDKLFFTGTMIKKNKTLQVPGRDAINISSKKYFLSLLALFLSVQIALADYTVASGSTIAASSLVGQTGILTINGTLGMGGGNVTLSGFTAVIINGPNGQILWTGNGDLTFSASATFTMNAGALGLQGGGNASQKFYIGGIDASGNGGGRFYVFICRIKCCRGHTPVYNLFFTRITRYNLL